MGTIAQKLEYLATTKTKIKDSINLTGAGITTEPFRQYAVKLKDAYVDIINNGTETLYNNFPKVSATGESMELSNTYEAPMNIDLKGNTSQVQLSGKNLFNPVIINNGTAIYTSNCTASVSNGVISITATNSGRLDFGAGAGSGTNYSNDRGVLIPVEPNTTYQLSLSNQTFQRFYINKWNSSKVSLGGNSLYLPNTSYTTDENTYYISLDLIYANAVSGTTYSTTVQVEKGSTPTSYEEYCGGVPSPNPSYPQDIHNVSGNNDIVVCGKNLFDKSTLPIVAYLTTYTELQNGIRATITSAGNNRYLVIKLSNNNLLGKTITLSSIITPSGTNNGLVRLFWLSGNTLTSKIGDNLKQTGNITWEIPTEYPSNCDGFALVFSSNNNGTSQNGDYVDYTNIQLEYGSTATPYEAYNGTTYPINLPSGMELCKIGTYQDYFYKEDDKWYLHKEIGKVVLDGSEEWNIANNVFYANVFTNRLAISGQTIPTYSDNYIFFGNVANTSGLTTNYNYATQNNLTQRILIRDERYTTTTDYSTWLSTHNTSVYYVLDTATNTEITDTTLISQLEAIYNAKSRNGETNINQVNNDLGFIITASALEKEQ